jgi:ABC-type uncharacterized transport system permease subunit
MPVTVLVSISAVLALVPAAVLPYRGGQSRDAVFWMLLGVGLIGAVLTVGLLFAPGWRTGIGSALWATLAVTLALFAIVAALSAEAWRLAALMLPYLILIGTIATIWQDSPERSLAAGSLGVWTAAHIVFALLAYGFLTIGAVAGAGAFVQERALKAKRPTRLSRLLPSISDGERLQVTMLGLSALLLAGGLATGIASRYVLDGLLLVWDHKTVLSSGTLVVLVILLAAHAHSGLRGRRAARIVLLAYLLLTLAYPGVKFVTDVLVG